MTMPTRLHVLRGNPSKGRIADEPQPELVTTLPEPPEILTEAAANQWWEVGPELQRLGLLTVCDLAVFSAYCQAYGRWFEAERLLRLEAQAGRADSALTAIGAQGGRVANPLVRISQSAADAMVAYAAQLGLSPIARRRIAIAGHIRGASKFSGLLGQ
jgi:P27 family predicted phage terminase small subunit